MASNKTSSPSSGIGFLGLFGVLFVGLKLAGVIGWPWWLVTLPFWGGFAVVIGGLLIWVGVALAADLFTSARK
jgi:hypothetical protein